MDAGRYPSAHDEHLWSTEWSSADAVAIPVASTVPSGKYDIMVSVYDPMTALYLQAQNQTGQDLGDSPVVASVIVEKDGSGSPSNQ